MSFYWPHLLWLLIVPAGWLAWELFGRRRKADAAQHPKILRAEIGRHDLSLVSSSAQRGPGRARPWLAVGLAFAIVALARPQWGRIEEPVFDQSREIIVAVDLSRSMLSTDVKPSRLERAKLLIQALLEKLQGERVGLVVFSGTAFLQSPMSSDYEILREFLPSLNPSFLPEGGTNYRALIDTSLDAFGSGSAADRFLIVLSDGEATDDDWQPRADELKKRGIRVIGLGVGTANGSMIPDGSGGFVKDDRGAVVLSKLESGTLEQLAQTTGGVYRDASQWIDLASLIDETVNAAQKGKFVDTRTVRLIERFQWPLALALWCLLVSFYYEFPVRPRARAVQLQPPRREPPPLPQPTTATVAAVALLAAWFVWPNTPARAAVKIAPPTTTATPATPPTPNTSPLSPIPNARPAPPLDQPPPLAKIVGRLAGADRRSALDWAEMAQETVAWGSRLKSAQHPVPEGPVHDALDAVDEGSKQDPRAADWSKLRDQLNELLQKQEPPKPPQQKQDQKDQKNQDQKNQDRQNQQQKDQSQKADSSQNQSQKNESEQPKDQNQSSEQNRADQKKSESKPADQSAFGNMKEPPKPQPMQSSEMQKVGGMQDKKNEKPPSDPTLALPLEKLDELKNQDSPAQLFQMLQAERNQASRTKPKKDW